MIAFLGLTPYRAALVAVSVAVVWVFWWVLREASEKTKPPGDDL